MGALGELRELEEEHWADVSLPWEEGPLLLTIGTDWLDGVPTQCPGGAPVTVDCAVLHRVADSLDRDRRSLPFLISLVRVPPTA